MTAQGNGAAPAAPAGRDWEASARARLERLVADTVDRIRSTADEIEREARRNVASAAEDTRDLEFQTYPRVAGQVIHSVQTLAFNLKLESLIDAAADAEAARTEKLAAAQTPPDHDPEQIRKTAVSGALYALLVNLDGWIEGAHENHEAMGHRGENTGEECWTSWAPADFRSMVNDVARELGVGEFPAPAAPREETIR